MLVSIMFIKSYAELPVGFDTVRAALLRPPRSWLDGAAEAAGRYADVLLLDVGLELRGREVTRCARLDAGVPIAGDRLVSVPIRLRVAEAVAQRLLEVVADGLVAREATDGGEHARTVPARTGRGLGQDAAPTRWPWRVPAGDSAGGYGP